MEVTRRSILAGFSATALGFAGLKRLSEAEAFANSTALGYGPLLPDSKRLLDPPFGFSYRIVSREGDAMSDGLRTPAAFDGMACFPVPGARDRVALVRNHEIWPNESAGGAFGARLNVPRSKIFDFQPDGRPKLGGTTTLVWDMRRQRLVSAHLSLAGTCGNCAGGTTPWGSWLSCEETIETDPPLVGRAHGWVFEVPAAARGACFSPDGSTLFVNVQSPGITFAVTGPWRHGRPPSLRA